MGIWGNCKIEEGLLQIGVWRHSKRKAVDKTKLEIIQVGRIYGYVFAFVL